MGAVMKTSYCFFAGAVGSSQCQCGRRCGIKFRIAPLRSRGLIVYKELDNSHEFSIKPRYLQVPTSSGTITRLDHINPTSHPDEKTPSPPRSISKMKPFLPFFAALVATVVADTMEITYICGGGFSCAGLATWHSDYGTYVELQRQFLALRRAGALPLQACLERRGLGSCALPTHRELPFVYKWGVLRTPLFYQIKSLCNCTSAAPKPLVPQPKRSTVMSPALSD